MASCMGCLHRTSPLSLFVSCPVFLPAMGVCLGCCKK